MFCPFKRLIEEVGLSLIECCSLVDCRFSVAVISGAYYSFILIMSFAFPSPKCETVESLCIALDSFKSRIE